MATKRLSPTASLLRNSRLFSLPPPLPRPTQRVAAGKRISESDTATLPYPTHAAIETTASSLSRGDWGLKRPLPLKSTTNTSTPIIRIDDVDSIDHITDFESAADHTLTLQKWQEIGLPISMPVTQRGGFISQRNLNTRDTTPTSVFEGIYDNTEKHPIASNAKRWKFKGPWLAGKTEGEFEQYLEKNVRRRKAEFKDFIRDRLETERAFERRREAQDSGEDFQGQLNVTDQDIDLYMKQLRRNQVQLQMLIEEFLDLPIAEDSHHSEGTFVSMMNSNTGPPKTHLSAGLSYLRTNSHMINHPVLGPMEEDPPVQARILRPQVVGDVNSVTAVLGIGGVAAEDSTKQIFAKDTYKGSRLDVPGIRAFEPDIDGGPKIWIRPDRASIDVHGKVKMHVLRVEPRDVTIYEGVVDEAAIGTSRSSYVSGSSSRMPKLDSMRRVESSKTSGYGSGREASDQSRQRTKPLDVPEGSVNSTEDLLELLAMTGNR